ncbi:MAG: cell division protein SepF [Propionibacteriaceae bacterium]|jgi:cell division inhibitor SepF|nr:cell division protein SepF [Propionibacteriaceae bacterium]
MAHRLKSLAEWAGIVQPSRYDDEDEFAETDAVVIDEPEAVTEAVTDQVPPAPARQANVTSLERHRARRLAPPRDAAIEEISHIRPRSYSADARRIADSYRDNVPVILNLSDVDTADAVRLVDFATGMAMALDGVLEKITARVFLLSPPSVRVTDQDKENLATGNLLAAQG